MNAPDNVFVRLAAINVNDHVEKKNNLSYLSWAWAVDQLMRVDPAANWAYGEPKLFGETMMVYCTVTAFGIERTAHLPVMDYRNKPIPNPDAFAVNTAMQRCLVKAIALHGLGLYIYAGEDLPEGEKKEEVTEKKNGNYKPAFNVLGFDPKVSPDFPLEPQDKVRVEEVVEKTLKWLANNKLSDAVLELDNADLHPDQWRYAWTFFDSSQRSGMKKEAARLKEEINKKELATQA